jgi:glycosyltransferase involved in cell wall biosynthesis
MRVDKRRPIRNLVNFRQFIANTKPDLLATYNWGTIEWAGVNSVWPICRHIHFEAGFGHEEIARQLRRRVIARRIALRKSDFVVVPSRTLQQIALEIWRLPFDQVRYIPDGIDVARFARSRPLALQRQRHTEHVVLGTVAPLRPEKNVGKLIEAFSLVANDPRFKLIIAGDGPDRTRLENLAARSGLGSRISFLGHVPHPEEVLPTFDIFGLSSDTEQIPNAVLEAMAAGLPIASVDVGDIRIMVPPSNQPYIVPREGVEALALAVRELGSDAHLRHLIGSVNRHHVEKHFGQERMFEEYEKLLLGPLEEVA